LFAQSLTGTWQGSLILPNGKELRTVVKVTTIDKDSLKGVFYSIDQSGQGISVASITLQGGTMKMAIPAIGGSYEGKMSADGNSIAGTFTQGPNPLPLNFTRATPGTEWAIPEPPAPVARMKADANPAFDVSTIKPSGPDSRGSTILVGRGGGNLFTTTNTSLKDLIVFAYGLHAKQVSGGPSWIENEHFDVTGKPDQPGLPSVTQLQSMLQKMIVERFQLTFHRENKELSVYAITIAKTGVKLNKSESTGNLPGFGFGRGNMSVQNSNMADFAIVLQSRVVDRPVVDQTSLPDRYDFQLKWTPDVSQPPAPGQPPAAPPVDAADAPPDLFAAFQQQLGLKLEATKAQVPVVVIDKVEKPTEN